MDTQLQRPSALTSLTAACVVALVALVAATVLLDLSDAQAVYASSYLFAACWVFGSTQLLWLRPADWIGGRRLQVAVVTLWTGLLAHGWHVAKAFEVFHGWSHAAAVEHSARTAGVGWGVYVNYLFAAVWLADTVWLGAATASYARRPRWLGRAVHGFLAFIVFNATVVYGEPATRLAGVGWFAILGFSWWRRHWFVARRASEDEPNPR